MNQVVQVEKVGFSGEIAKLTPRSSERDISLVPSMLVAFDRLVKQNFCYFIVDLKNIEELPPSLIVMLFEMTAKARRRGGDVKVINLSKMSYNNLLTFNPMSYLSSGRDESEALTEFEERIKFDKEPETEADPVPVPPSISTTKLANRSFIEIPSQVSDLYRVSDFVLDIARKMGFPDGELSKIKIAVYEGCLNAIEHAYHSDPQQTVKVIVENTDNRLEIQVIDYGEGFQVDTSKEFDVIKAAQERSRGGMGLHIIQRSMNELRYEMDPFSGNRLIMVKYLDPQKASKEEKVEPAMDRNDE